MPPRLLHSYPRTVATAAVSGVLLGLAIPGVLNPAWHQLLPMFEWMETTLPGVVARTWGATFALAEALHLLGMALLGGAVLVSDGRLLGIVLRDVPARIILEKAHRLFVVGLLVTVASGLFMACGVALKIYYLPVFWFKMLALLLGALFAFAIKRPLLADGVETLNPWVVRAAAAASLTVWFTVAATGRWIGFSG